MTDTLIDIRDLTVAFGGQPVVRNLSLQIQPGECLALVGESGSGKSVTAHSILQLLPSTGCHSSGSVLYRGQQLLGASEQRLREVRGNRIAMIFQEPMTSLNPLHTVQKQIGETLLVHKGMAGKQAQARILELLDLVGIQKPQERLKAYPHQLSGGQRQRVMIAMALACEPELLIADEPTTALDVTVQRRILHLLKSLQQRLGMSLLLISHDLNLVRSIAQRVCVMRAGEIVEQADCQTLFTAPQHPYSRLLLDAEPTGDTLCGDERETVLQVEDLSVQFRLGGGLFQRKTYLRAVDGISLSVQRGKTLGIVGESGSGKSTLGQAILRLLDSHGSIRFQGQALADDLLHRHARAEAAIGVLEHHLHLLAPWAHLLMVKWVEGLALEADAAAGVEQAQDRLAQGGLARAGLADDPQGLAALHAEADAVHCMQVGLAPKQSATEGEFHAQVIHLQHRLALIAAQRIARRLGVQQQAAVGVLRGRKQCLAVGLLNDFAGMHHADTLGNAAYQVEVMADQQQ